MQSFDRLPDEVDVMVRLNSPSIQPTAARDGGEGLDIALMAGTEISVLPGRVLVEAAGR